MSDLKYKNKYIKYKNKYTNLKMMGGANNSNEYTFNTNNNKFRINVTFLSKLDELTHDYISVILNPRIYFENYIFNVRDYVRFLKKLILIIENYIIEEYIKNTYNNIDQVNKYININKSDHDCTLNYTQIQENIFKYMDVDSKKICILSRIKENENLKKEINTSINNNIFLDQLNKSVTTTDVSFYIPTEKNAEIFIAQKVKEITSFTDKKLTFTLKPMN